MAKKKFGRRPSGGGRSQGGYGGGGGGGGYYQGGGGNGYGGGGNGRPRRGGGGGRRRPDGGGYRDRGPDRGPGAPYPATEGGEPRGFGELPPEGAEGQPQLNPDGTVAEGAMPGGYHTEPETIPGYGLLEMHPNGYGFLRSPETGYSRERSDPFVPGTMIERYGLRQGVMIRGTVQPGRRQQGPRLRDITDVDGMVPDDYLNVKTFDVKTPINPNQWFHLETGATPLTTRVMDLLTPLGRGQRALIVAPPRTGKTILLQHISQAMTINFPEVKQFILLIDERPEEVTDMRRNVQGEVCASTLDNDIESHVRLSQLVIERCRRLAEMGQDVFLLLDSITRLARAFNKYVGGRGDAIQTGGLSVKAMDIPKKLFATARAFEEGGSLTICGTALIETNSRMDDAIFQEFKGTGNMELVLDRKLAERRVWPALDVSQSGTRREELLLDADTLHAVTMLRRTLSSMHPTDAMEQLIKQLSRFKTNAEFIKLISSARLD